MTECVLVHMYVYMHVCRHACMYIGMYTYLFTLMEFHYHKGIPLFPEFHYFLNSALPGIHYFHNNIVPEFPGIRILEFQNLQNLDIPENKRC